MKTHTILAAVMFVALGLSLASGFTTGKADLAGARIAGGSGGGIGGTGRTPTKPATGTKKPLLIHMARGSGGGIDGTG